jgi:hypothetical protein
MEVADALDKAPRQEIIQKTILDPLRGGNAALDNSIRGTMR